MPVCASPLTKTPSGQTANDEAEADDDDSRWRECIVGPPLAYQWRNWPQRHTQPQPNQTSRSMITTR